MTPNLFASDWTAATIEEILVRQPRKALLPPIGAKAWLRAAINPTIQQWMKPLRNRAEEECAGPLPVLTDELYADFALTGNRLRFEILYFERRRHLARAAMSLLLCGEGDSWRERLVASMLAKLTSIFEEESWSLPAHVTSEHESGKDLLRIDLFCAETANLMAEMLDLFGAIIPASLQERVRERLQSAVFENYLNGTSHGWIESPNNWNSVCHQGVIGAALSQLDDPRMLAELLLKARKHLPAFLNGYGADGGTSEGPGYWVYGFGWFAVLNEQLEARTGGELSFFEGDEHIRQIALFGPRVSLAGGKLVNFADGGGVGGLKPSLLAYLGKRLDERECSFSSQENYRRTAADGLELDIERCDLFYLVRLFLLCPEDLSPADGPVAKDCFLPDLSVLVAHGTDRQGYYWEFAAKAGHNDEHHNHNDCGSYILNIDGVRLIAEIGAPEYVRDFFSDKRYEFLAARTLGHSLPIINGCEQAAGAAYASHVASHFLGAQEVTFAVNATACYPPEAGCLRFERSFRFDKHLGRLTVEDVFELSRPVSLESGIITFQPISLVGSHALIEAEGLQLIMRPTLGTRLDRIESHSYQDHDGNEAKVYRLVLKPDVLASQVSLGIGMELL